MRGAMYFLAAALVALSAFWAYRVNYEAKGALDRVSGLRRAIAAEREAIAVLRAEWAWLSAPDRVRALVAANAEALGLEPMTAMSYVAIDRLPSPPPESFWVRAEPGEFHPDPDALAAGPFQTERTP